MSEIVQENQNPQQAESSAIPSPPPGQESYVKWAMRNMVRKKAVSLKHFFLTVSGLLAFLVGISYLTR